MPATLRHFSINADDLPRARAFYEAVFSWSFAPWGPPNFLTLSGAGVGGALQGRHTLGGREMPGIEVGFAVDDITATAAAVEAQGGTILMPEYNLEGVGRMITFEDPEGGVVKACQYERRFEPTATPGAGRVRHFAINAGDVPRARGFYEEVFGWSFTPWGPPGFYQTRSSGAGHLGALQGRRSIGGRTMPGIELTFGVDDLAATIAAIEAHGGEILMPPFRIEGVGELIFFHDCEGNVAGAMQYDEGNW
jgi:predicted enzyme related to lactoylglutathione lyase